jgi:hypothetical protein
LLRRASSRQSFRKANHQTARTGVGRAVHFADLMQGRSQTPYFSAVRPAGLRFRARQKTRPSAQYTANDLASPDIEIGSRHPVNYTLPRYFPGKCDPFHNRREKVAGSSFGGMALPRAARGVRKPALRLSPATSHACDARSLSRGIWSGSIYCASMRGRMLRELARLRMTAAGRRSPR